MEHLYNFYVDINNIENKNLKLNPQEVKLLDKIWSKILRKAKVKPDEKKLSEIVKNVQQSV